MSQLEFLSSALKGYFTTRACAQRNEKMVTHLPSNFLQSRLWVDQQPSPRSAKIIFKCPTQFLFKRKSGISHRDFLHIDQALKPRPCGPCWTFPSEPFARKREAFVLNASIFKDVIVAFRWKDFTLPVQIPHPSQAKFKYPHPTGTDDDQVSVGCRGGGGWSWSFKLICAWRTRILLTDLKSVT